METTWNLSDVIHLVITIAVTLWVYMDAKAIGSDYGQSPGLVDTLPILWAIGVFVSLLVFLPTYLLMRVRYKRLLFERLTKAAVLRVEALGSPAETAGVWPPPPQQPAA